MSRTLTFLGLALFLSFSSACYQEVTPPGGPAAGPDAPADPQPAPGPAPSSPTLLANMPADGATGVATQDVVLQFSEPMDPTTTIAAVSFEPPIDCAAIVDGDAYRCSGATLRPSTTYVVIVHDSARSVANRALDGEHSFSFKSAAAVITSVKVGAGLGKQVRQGAGEITLTATGAGLALVSDATLGDLSGVIVSATDVELVTKFVVPHGQKVGGLTLSLTIAADTVDHPEAVIVTELTCAVGVGNDSWAGTPEAPFATLSHALGIANDGDVIKLADGLYGPAETWATSTPNVPKGVTIQGTSLAGTILEPPMGTSTTLTGLWFAGEGNVSQLTMRGFLRGAYANGSGYVSFDTVRINSCALDGLSLGGNAASLAVHLELTTNGASGLRLQDAAQIDATYSNIHDNHEAGIVAGGISRLGLIGSAIANNGTKVSTGDGGVLLIEQASASIGADVTGNAAAGVYSQSTGSLALAGTFSGNGTAAGCGISPECSGVAIAAVEAVSIQGHLDNNKTYGLVSRGRHSTIQLNGATLSGNGLGNATFDDTDTSTAGYTSVQLINTVLSNSPTGIAWGDHVKISMSGGSVSGHTTDLFDSMSVNSFAPTFSEVRFGPTLAVYPPKPGTLIVSNASNVSGIGPSWSITYPSTSGGAGAITFVH